MSLPNATKTDAILATGAFEHPVIKALALWANPVRLPRPVSRPAMSMMNPLLLVRILGSLDPFIQELMKLTKRGVRCLWLQYWCLQESVAARHDAPMILGCQMCGVHCFSDWSVHLGQRQLEILGIFDWKWTMGGGIETAKLRKGRKGFLEKVQATVVGHRSP